MPKNDRGYAIRYSFPSREWLTDFPELVPLYDEYRRLTAEQGAAASTAKGLQNLRPHAKQADTNSLADALRRGDQVHPDQAELRAIDQRIAEAQRLTEAYDVALDELEREMGDVVDQHRERWIREAVARIPTLREGLAKAVDEWVDARNAIAALESAVGWVATFAPGRQGGALRAPHVRTAMPNLVGPNGDPYVWSAVADSLRADTQPSEVERYYAAPAVEEEQAAEPSAIG